MNLITPFEFIVILIRNLGLPDDVPVPTKQPQIEQDILKARVVFKVTLGRSSYV